MASSCRARLACALLVCTYAAAAAREATQCMREFSGAFRSATVVEDKCALLTAFAGCNAQVDDSDPLKQVSIDLHEGRQATVPECAPAQTPPAVAATTVPTAACNSPKAAGLIKTRSAGGSGCTFEFPRGSAKRLPSALGLAAGARALDLGDAGLVGRLPDLCAAFPSLERLVLGGNVGLDPGPLPHWLAACKRLVFVDFSATNRNGKLELCDLLPAKNTLTTLRLGNNAFEPAPLPFFLAHFPVLADVGLANANIVGPADVGECAGQVAASLARAHIVGGNHTATKPCACAAGFTGARCQTAPTTTTATTTTVTRAPTTVASAGGAGAAAGGDAAGRSKAAGAAAPGTSGGSAAAKASADEGATVVAENAVRAKKAKETIEAKQSKTEVAKTKLEAKYNADGCGKENEQEGCAAQKAELDAVSDELGDLQNELDKAVAALADAKQAAERGGDSPASSAPETAKATSDDDAGGDSTDFTTIAVVVILLALLVGGIVVCAVMRRSQLREREKMVEMLQLARKDSLRDAARRGSTQTKKKKKKKSTKTAGSTDGGGLKLSVRGTTNPLRDDGNTTGSEPAAADPLYSTAEFADPPGGGDSTYEYGGFDAALKGLQHNTAYGGAGDSNLYGGDSSTYADPDDQLANPGGYLDVAANSNQGGVVPINDDQGDATFRIPTEDPDGNPGGYLDVQPGVAANEAVPDGPLEF